ncbi:MAG: phospholipase [Halomonas sp.]|nr:prolyl oligopeptidase family serine peptidase [Halomonas sp.]TVP51167.1 MAG: phospholipase [Halomonas sp.]
MLRYLLSLAALGAIVMGNPSLVFAPVMADQVAITSDSKIPNDLNYLLYTPEDYETSEEPYPLVVWLHGGGQSGDDINDVRSSGLPNIIEQGSDLPFFVFSPQNPSEDLLYPIEKVKNVLDELVSEFRVDPSRIYVMGYSRGGFGAWAMAKQFPDTFAAVVPIAGGGVRYYLNRTNEQTAFWIFHGSRDDVIPLSDSVVLYERLKSLDRDARLTVFDADHEEIESLTLNQSAMWDWLLQQQLETE